MSAPLKLRLVGATAFRTFRNVWMLEELGVAYDHTICRPRSAEAAVDNPFGKIPSLQDGDFTMYESAAINTYLADKFRGEEGVPNLVPQAGTQQRGRYEQLTMCIMSELDAQGLWIHRKHDSLGRIFGTIPDAVAHAKTQAARSVGVMAAELRRGGGPFLLGAEFSAADILLVHSLDWAELIGWGEAWTTAPSAEAEDMQCLAAYLEVCRSRPAYVRAVAKKDAESQSY